MRSPVSATQCVSEVRILLSLDGQSEAFSRGPGRKR